MRHLLIVLSIPLVGCAGQLNVNDDDDTGGGIDDVGDIEDSEDVLEACEEYADQILTETFRVEFPATHGGCPWGEDGNLGQQQGVLTARVEETESLDLEGLVVCDMDFAFAGEAGLEQDIVYDDNFIFVFNGVVLASSYRPWIDQLESEDVFRIYDWDRIVGLENDFSSSIPTYCVGEDTDLAECDIPPPETHGPISLSFELAITSELSFRAIDEQRSEFTFIATGDNDSQVDCSHDAFYFDVEVPYLDL